MHVVVADSDLRVVLPRPLASAGWTLRRGDGRGGPDPDVVLAGIRLAMDAPRIREARGRLGNPPLVVLTRVPLRILPEVRDHVTGFILPAFPEREPVAPSDRRPMPRLAVVTTLGPPEGPPRRFHRRALRDLRAAGVSGALHGDMQEWLTSTAAWSVPLSGAMHVAAAWGSDLRRMPMLGALAARAAREQIGLARRAGLRLESRARWLSRTSESLAIEGMHRLAAHAERGRVVEGLPSLGEVLASRPYFQGLQASLGESTPASDALEALVLSLPSEDLHLERPPARHGPDLSSGQP